MADWKRSSFCALGDCVEVASSSPDLVAVRASVYPDEVVIFLKTEWSEFIKGVKNGEFDVMESRSRDQGVTPDV